MPPEVGIAANVARLRLDRRLTQAALAERAGLSRVAIGKIERGAVLPRSRTLAALAGALGVPIRDLVIPVRPLRSVRFRAHSTMYGREQTLAEVSRWLDDYVWLEAELKESQSFRFQEILATNGTGRPEEVATAARQAAGLGPRVPVTNVGRVLEDSGVKILLLDKKRDSFYGLSVGPEDRGPAVVVNAWARISVERWIFTAAHELGHLLLHSAEYRSEQTDLLQEAEAEADTFASEFLMPESAFAAEWEATRGYALPERVLAVKRTFRVSYRTVLYRLVNTGREDHGVWTRFEMQHRNRRGRTRDQRDKALQASEYTWNWHRAGEPVALSEYDFRPERFSRLVRQALEGGHISLGRAAEILGIPMKEMMGWCGTGPCSQTRLGGTR